MESAAADPTVAGTAQRQTTAQHQTKAAPIATAHGANREPAKVMTTVAGAEAEAAEVPTRQTMGAAGAAAEPALPRARTTDALYPRDSQRRRQHHQVHRSGRDPYPNGRALNRKGEVQEAQN